jgi:RIO-like serine/threonine protein kinase
VLRQPHGASAFGQTLAALTLPHVLTPLLLLEAPARLAPKLLTRRLGELLELGLVERRAFRELPPRVEYSLTTKGRELLVVYRLLYGWHLRHGGPALEEGDDQRLRLGLAGPPAIRA